MFWNLVLVEPLDYWQCVTLHTREAKNRNVSLLPSPTPLHLSLPPRRARGFPFRESQQPERSVTGRLQLDHPGGGGGKGGVLDVHWRARDTASCSIKTITLNRPNKQNQTERFNRDILSLSSKAVTPIVLWTSQSNLISRRTHVP